MKKAYLSISFQNRKNLESELVAIQQALSAFNIHLFVFVDQYLFTKDQEKQMMQQAFADIDSSDLLIAEVSEKAIGVGIEIGYAIAAKKPVIYLRNELAEHSTTAAGSADHIIIYNNPENLSKKLTILLSHIIC
jgi:nucleoside 2-deoxyribosyltransferase